MISEGSCDTEDWSNDAEHSALNIFFLNISFKIYWNCSHYFLLFKIVL